jgi:hypothetical protein
MTEDHERQLFVSECLRLKNFITMYCSCGFSDREITTVLCNILKEVTNRQTNPEGALEQVIQVMRLK